MTTNAWHVLEAARWPNGTECPHCGLLSNAYLIQRSNGSDRRMWKCAGCKKQFSVLVGTVMHRSHVSPAEWVEAIRLLWDKPFVSTAEVQRAIGTTYLTARRVVSRIVSAKTNNWDGLPFSAALREVVSADPSTAAATAVPITCMHTRDPSYAAGTCDDCFVKSRSTLAETP